jgi:predicted regulator of Ras-like GTPase activity (Roadblock/LC7/MglB family)
VIGRPDQQEKAVENQESGPSGETLGSGGVPELSEEPDQPRGIAGWVRPYVQDLGGPDAPDVPEPAPPLGAEAAPVVPAAPAVPAAVAPTIPDQTAEPRATGRRRAPDAPPAPQHAHVKPPPAPKKGTEPMSKQEDLARVIYEMRRSIPELNGVMIASTDGLAIAHDFPESEAERVAAMAATALGLGKRITERTNLGGLLETVVRGDHGYLVVYSAGENAVLVMSGPITSNLGLMRIEARAASSAVAKVLS